MKFIDNSAGGTHEVALSGNGISAEPTYTIQSLRTRSVGTVTMVLKPKDPGAATLTVTVPTGSVSNKSNWKTGRTMINGKCRPINTVVGVAHGTGRPGVPRVLRINATGKIKAALNSGKTLHILATLVYRPAGGGRPSITTRHLTLTGKEKTK